MNSSSELPLLSLRAFLALAHPDEVHYKTHLEVPNFVMRAVPYMLLMLGIEYVLISKRKVGRMRLNDGVSSVVSGILSRLSPKYYEKYVMIFYVYVYENYKVVDLSSHYYFEYFLTFIVVDFFYYWFHRMCHEVNFFWAMHQVHHSSEDYNLTTALRQSMFQGFFGFLTSLPMALFISPPIFVVQSMFNLLFQFWIHTEQVKNIGWLEYIINNPSAHRVHHGRNPYCIDKNYAGTLMIWDYLFGTYQKENEKVYYGLVSPLSSWDPIHTQLLYFRHIFKNMLSNVSLKHWFNCIFKGPGWTPENGYNNPIPEVETPVQIYDNDSHLWGYNVYAAINVLILLAISAVISDDASVFVFLLYHSYIILSVYIIMAELESRSWAIKAELMRNLATVTFIIIFKNFCMYTTNSSVNALRLIAGVFTFNVIILYTWHKRNLKKFK